MNREQLMNQQHMEVLKTIRKESPSLRTYMTDLLNEMEDPESAFNTGKISRWSNLDKLTVMRLCDAFAVAQKYSEKYHLDLPELIEFVSEKTLEILSEDQTLLTTPFKERIKYLIRQQFPFRNALLSRTGKQNRLSYDLYDRDNRLGRIDEDGRYYCDDYPKENIELNVPIRFTKDSNITYTKIWADVETKERNARILKMLELLTPREEQVIRFRFGLDDGRPRTLEEVARNYGTYTTRERIRQIEAHAIRKLHSRKARNFLAGWLDEDNYYTPFQFANIRKATIANNFNTLICLQPYCVCRHQMRYQQTALIDDNPKMVFYCRKCGRIYRFTNGKVKMVRAYHLKGYTLDNIPEKWPLFHWDKTSTDDFSKRIEKYENKMEMLHYVERIRQRYNDNLILSSAKESEVRNIYNLMNKNIISAEEAKEKYFKALRRFFLFKEYPQDDSEQLD